MDQNEVLNNSINSDLIRGHIDTIILKALQAGDRYGYDIIKEIEHKSNGQYIIKQPTLYSCLKRLEVQGFVKSYWGSKSIGGRKKYFTLTDMGRELFLRNKSDWDYSRDIINRLISDEDYSAIYDAQGAEESMETDAPLLDSENSLGALSEFDNQEELPVENSSLENQDEQATIEEADAQEDILHIFSNDQFGFIDDNDRPTEIAQVKEIESVEQEEQKKATDENIKTLEDDTNDLPLSPSEQKNIMDEPVDYNDSEDLISRFYDEYSRDSYLTNIDNAEYVPPISDAINPDDYFSDIIEDEYEDEEVASTIPPVIEKDVNTVETVETHDDGKFLPPEEPIRRIVREAPAEKTVFYSYKRPVGDMDEYTAVIDKEYRSVITKLINDNIVNSEPVKAASNFDYANADYFNSETTQKYEVKEQQTPPPITQLNEDEDERLEVRKHNDQDIRKYNNKHYYYSNQLRLLQCGIIFGIMLVEIIACFYFIEVMHNSMQVSKVSLGVYIAAVVFAALLPIVSFIMASTNYYKRVRLDNYSGKSSAFFAIAGTILLSLIVIFANIYGGILIKGVNINNYLSTLIMPIVLSTNLIVNAIVFHSLYTSGKYNVEE